MRNYHLYNVTFTPEGTLQCATHSSQIQHFYYDPAPSSYVGAIVRLLCSECFKEGPSNIPFFDKNHLHKNHFQIYSHLKSYVISLLNVPKLNVDLTSQHKPPMDFLHCQLEHIITVQDPNSSGKTCSTYGFYPRALAYITDKNILAAGGLDGHLYFWAINATVEFVRKINIGKPIKFLKYLDLDEKGKCLIVGAESGVHFYDIQGEEPKYIETMTCEAATNDIAYISHMRKLITVGRDSLVRFWSLENSSWKGEKVPKSYGINSPIRSVEYIQESDCLVLETDGGLYLLDLKKKELKDTEEVFTESKREFSLGHLAKSGHLLLFNKSTGLSVLDARDFKVLTEYPGYKPIGVAPGFNYIANEDESQFIGNGNSSSAYICDKEATHKMELAPLVSKSSAVEILHDQYRFVIADQHNGTLLVFRTNVQGEKLHLIEKTDPKKIIFEPETGSGSEESQEEVHIAQEVHVEEGEVYMRKEKVPRIKKAIGPKKTVPRVLAAAAAAAKKTRKETNNY